ncbi:lactonase family protein [Streptomyces sp. NPDC057616]|uniref:lactonase family protein n=1 Tax=Streptomyces sp. NPDC057616 TaxID=3346183 RepID=UPI003696BCAD
MKKMNRIARSATTAVAIATGVAMFTAPASASPHHPRQEASDGPVFVQSDAEDGNTVVAYDRADDGTLKQQGVYATGGLGGKLDGAVVDNLASQGSLTYDPAHRLLYAVNAGSDTVTVFAVHGDRLVRRQIVASGGRFPVSVTVHGNLVYVLNALDGGSVQGYLSVAGHLVRVPSWHRGLGLDPAATPQFTHTPGQIGFTPDGSRLIVTTKAGGNSFEVFRVGLPGIATKPVITGAPGSVPFGFSFDRSGRLVVTEAGPNAVATYRVDGDDHLTKVDEKATGQAATCWVATVGNDVYAANAGSGTLSGLRTGRDGTLTSLTTTPTAAGTVDVSVSGDGRFLYAQTGAAGGVDAFRVNADGSLTRTGSVVVPGAVGGEGIVAL